MVQTKYDVPVRRAFRWASEQQSCSAEASMIVRIPAPWLTKEIIFVCTVFLSFTLWLTCERALIHAHLRCELHHRICNLRYGMSAYIGFCCSYSGLTDFIDTIPRLLYTKPTSKSQTNNSYDYETFVIVIILTTFLSADPKPDIWLRV